MHTYLSVISRRPGKGGVTSHKWKFIVAFIKENVGPTFRQKG